jgi:hypothetical protein
VTPELARCLFGPIEGISEIEEEDLNIQEFQIRRAGIFDEAVAIVPQ